MNIILKDSFLTVTSFLKVSLSILPQELIKGYPEKLNHLGEHVRKRRLELGLTQKEVGKFLGVSEETVYNWESGKKQPDVKLIPKIIKFLGYVPFEPEGDDLISRLKFYKLINGLTVEGLAERISRHPDQVRSWLTGRRKPSRKNEKWIEEILKEFFCNLLL